MLRYSSAREARVHIWSDIVAHNGSRYVVPCILASLDCRTLSAVLVFLLTVAFRFPGVHWTATLPGRDCAVLATLLVVGPAAYPAVGSRAPVTLGELGALYQELSQAEYGTQFKVVSLLLLACGAAGVIQVIRLTVSYIDSFLRGQIFVGSVDCSRFDPCVKFLTLLRTMSGWQIKRREIRGLGP